MRLVWQRSFVYITLTLPFTNLNFACQQSFVYSTDYLFTTKVNFTWQWSFVYSTNYLFIIKLCVILKHLTTHALTVRCVLIAIMFLQKRVLETFVLMPLCDWFCLYFLSTRLTLIQKTLSSLQIRILRTIPLKTFTNPFKYSRFK